MNHMLLLARVLFLPASFVISACSSPPTSPQTVRIRWSKDAETLDPLQAKTSQDREIEGLTQGSLLVLDAQLLRMVPYLAEDLPQIHTQDSLTYMTYTLRPEAAWAPNHPVLAVDVAYTLKVMYCPGLPTELMLLNYGFVRDIELDSLNPRRFTLVCTRASVEELQVNSGDFTILSEYALDPAHTLRAVPLSQLRRDPTTAQRRYPALQALADRYRRARADQQPTAGPYQVSAWQRDQVLTLQRKTTWWGDRLASPPSWLQAGPAELVYHIIPDQATALLALRRGAVDLYPMPPARAYTQLQHGPDSSQFVFRTADSYTMMTAGFNTEAPVLRDAATRRALCLLFDVDGLIQATQPLLAYRSVGLINPHDPLAYNAQMPLLPYAPGQARAQLLAAGWQPNRDNTLWRGGQQLTLSLRYSAGDAEQELIALQFRAAAEQIGISIVLLPTEGMLLQELLRTGVIEAYLGRLTGSPVSYNLQPILHSSGIAAYNYSRLRDEAMDNVIMAISRETHLLRRAQLLRRFQTLMRQQAPLVVLYFTRNRIIASRRLGQVKATSIQPGYEASHLLPTAPLP